MYTWVNYNCLRNILKLQLRKSAKKNVENPQKKGISALAPAWQHRGKGRGGKRLLFKELGANKTSSCVAQGEEKERTFSVEQLHRKSFLATISSENENGCMKTSRTKTFITEIHDCAFFNVALR